MEGKVFQSLQVLGMKEDLWERVRRLDSMTIVADWMYSQPCIIRFYPDFCIFRTELPSPISFLLKSNTEKVST